jgi:Restriction endonuclease
MSPVLRFDDGSPFRASRSWAQAWVDGAKRYWQLVLDDYRERTNIYYADKVAANPSAFSLIAPTEILVIVSLVKSWTFARPSDRDDVRLVERWEDDVLAQASILHAPDHEAQVRERLGITDEYRLLNETDMVQRASWDSPLRGGSPRDPFENMRFPGHHMEGWDLADRDNYLADLRDALDGMMHRRLDRGALKELRSELERVESMSDAAARGLQFESFIERLLRAHGCDVERGKGRPGEQVDLFVHRPFRSLVECRWRDDRVDVSAVALLIAKLTRERPAIVTGIYVSMSGFTSGSWSEAAKHARERVVVLFDRNDIQRLLDGDPHIADLLDDRIDALIRRDQFG